MIRSKYKRNTKAMVSKKRFVVEMYDTCNDSIVTADTIKSVIGEGIANLENIDVKEVLYKEISGSKEIAKLKNDMADFCKKYSHQNKGDCYKCPVGEQIREHCKVDGVIRFLEGLINK